MQLDWIPISKPPKEGCGWYAGALSPINHLELEDKGNSWRKQFGFQKVWYNKDAYQHWWYYDHISKHTTPVSDRITHWAYLPDVPQL